MVEILENSSGEYQLHFKSSNGNLLLKSVSFKNEAEAKGVLNQTFSNPIFERTTDHQGKFIIHLKTKTGERVGQSNTYSSEAGMENGIKNLKETILRNKQNR